MEGHTSCTLEDTRNSELVGDFNHKMPEYNNEVYIVTWTTGESRDKQDDILLRSLTINSTKMDILIKDEIVKNNCLSLGFGFNKTLTDVMKKAINITSGQPRMHHFSADALKSIDSKLAINQVHVSERQQQTVPVGRLHVLKEALTQNIQRFLKQDSKNHTRHPQMTGISLNTAWTLELDTIRQKYICQNPVVLTHSRFNLKARAANIFALSAFTHLFRSCSMGIVLPLVSPCFSGISMLQNNIPFPPRDDRKERKMIFQLQRDSEAMDYSNLRTSVMLIVNEQNTTMPVMSISLLKGGHIHIFTYKKYLAIAYTLCWKLLINNLKLLYIKQAHTEGGGIGRMALFYLYIVSAH